VNATFRALSDPTRREILRLLADRDMSAGEIAAGFRMSKPSISHHLGVLKQAALVQNERRGQNIIYSLDTTVFQDMLAWMAGLAGKKRPIG
jgi:DNA-binding transcriptional ArsR family regulator